MKTLHNNFIDSSGRVYCYKYDRFLKSSELFIDSTCNNCVYMRGGLLGDGVSCEYDDLSGVDEITFNDAGDSELHSKMAQVRLGLKTKKEVLHALKSYNDYSEEEKIEEEDVPPPPEKEDKK